MYIVGHTIMEEGVRPHILHILPGRMESVYLTGRGGKQSSRLDITEQFQTAAEPSPVAAQFTRFS